MAGYARRLDAPRVSGSVGTHSSSSLILPACLPTPFSQPFIHQNSHSATTARLTEWDLAARPGRRPLRLASPRLAAAQARAVAHPATLRTAARRAAAQARPQRVRPSLSLEHPRIAVPTDAVPRPLRRAQLARPKLPLRRANPSTTTAAQLAAARQLNQLPSKNAAAMPAAPVQLPAPRARRLHAATVSPTSPKIGFITLLEPTRGLPRRAGSARLLRQMRLRSRQC